MQCQNRRRDNGRSNGKYKSIFNQIESLYDTFLKNTKIERQYTDLKQIRGHIALTLHLLEIGKALTHFHERHSDKLKKYSSSSRATPLFQNDTIKKTVREFILNYTIHFLLAGKITSIKIFKRWIWTLKSLSILQKTYLVFLQDRGLPLKTNNACYSDSREIQT